jgi:exopolyphosphatase / guanosine-5'-triphosphate,3'-diphosphate pyrophosphatase
MRLAVIDLGTNTFNLLIAEVQEREPFFMICSNKEPVKLGEGGINQRIIAPAAYERGLAAIHKYSKYLDEYKVEKVYAYATSAIRSAENGLQFIEEVSEKFNISVELISGDREAELIYYGVRYGINLGQQKSLILDIGGGSNELIIANENTIFWKESFPLGMARLLERFNPSDPITLAEIQSIEDYAEEKLSSFFKAMLEHQPGILIGASGSFDTFRTLLKENFNRKKEDENGKACYEMDLTLFGKLHNSLITSTREARLKMKGMEPLRVEMIVLASIFVNFILQKTDIKKLVQCSFSLKEGALDQIIKKEFSFA